MKNIKIATIGLPSDYLDSLIPAIIKSAGYAIKWTDLNKADLCIFGPFNRIKNKNRWLPRPLRPKLEKLLSFTRRSRMPLTLFHTAENLRYDHIPCNFSISFDLAVENTNHFRLPYWMEVIDWSHEGVIGNKNPRYGRLLDLNRLMQPLGPDFIKRKRNAVIFSSHLREPRATLLRAVAKSISIDGHGPAFDRTLSSHFNNQFTKKDILTKYAFNLCPENSLYPGYYTEKIPESFMAGCLPLTWVESNVSVDFNPKSFLNLAPMTAENFSELDSQIKSDWHLQKFAVEPLLKEKPNTEGIYKFIGNVISQATS